MADARLIDQATEIRLEVVVEALALEVRARPIAIPGADLAYREEGGDLRLLGPGIEGHERRAILLLRGEVRDQRRLPEMLMPEIYHPGRGRIAYVMAHGYGSGNRGGSLLLHPSFDNWHFNIGALAAAPYHDDPPFSPVTPRWLDEAELVKFEWRSLGRVRWRIEAPIESRAAQ